MTAALLALTLAAGGLSVNTLSPDALCPALESTRQAVAARLGQVELEGDWTAEYVVVHRRRGDFVDLQLRDGRSVVRLKRELPLRGESCATLAQAIALVLERFFVEPEGAAAPETHLEAKAPNPLPSQPKALDAPLPPPNSRPNAGEPARTSEGTHAEAPPAQTQPSQGQTLESETVGRSPLRGWIGVGMAGSNAWLGPMGAFGLRYRRLQLGFGAVLDVATHRQDFAEGQLALHRTPLLIQGLFEVWGRGRTRLDLGLEFLGLVESAETLRLANNGGGTRFLPGLGLAAEGSFLLLRDRLRLLLNLSGTWLPQVASEFQVDRDLVLEPPRGILGLRLGIQAAPRFLGGQ